MTAAHQRLPLYNIIAWLCPLLVTVPLTAVGKLGYARYAASNWCFVKDLTSGATNTSGITTTNVSTGLLTSVETIVFIFVAGKLWEILTYFGVILIYTHITGHLSRVPSHFVCTVIVKIILIVRVSLIELNLTTSLCYLCSF